MEEVGCSSHGGEGRGRRATTDDDAIMPGLWTHGAPNQGRGRTGKEGQQYFSKGKPVVEEACMLEVG